MAALRPDEDIEYVRRAVDRFAERLSAVVDRYRDVGRAPSELLGEPEDLADRAVLAHAPAVSPWDELIGPFLRSDGVQARLGISRQAVAAKAARRRLLRVFTADDIALFPIWQFADGAVVPGLAPILASFPEDAVDGWTLAGWLRSTDAELDAVPLEVLLAGEVDRVRSVARSAARSLGA